MTVSNLYFELSGDATRLNKALEEAVNNAKAAGIKISGAGKNLIKTFDDALNPTKRLNDQIKVLEASGRSSADIMRVYGDRIHEATRRAREMGQPIDDLVKKYETLGMRMQSAGEKAKRVGETLTQVGRSMTLYVTAPIVGAGFAAVKLAGDFEQTTIAFNTMLGSAERAGKFLGELEKFAAKTPFEFKDLTEASKRMLALGFSADQILPSMEAIGNAVAALGGGSELINRVTLALGQMQAKGKVSAEEMRQLAEAGIPAWEILAKNIGVEIPEAMDLARKGAIKASDALPAIIAGMNERFAGLMDQQSKTLLGQISNLKDELFFVIRDFGTELIKMAPAITDALKNILAQVKSMVEWFVELDPHWQKIVVGAFAATAALGPLALAIGGITKAVGGLSVALGAAGGAGLIGKLGLLAKAAGAVGIIVGVYEGLKKIEDLDIYDRLWGAGPGRDKATINLAEQAAALREQAEAFGLIAEKIAENQELIARGAISEETIRSEFERAYNESLKDYVERLQGLVDGYKEAHPEIEKTAKALTAVHNEAERGIDLLNAELDAARTRGEQIARGAIRLRDETNDLLGISRDIYADSVEGLKKENEETAKLIEKEWERINAGTREGEIIEDNGRKWVDVAEQHVKAYRKMIDNVRDGAGQVFDAIVSRGEGAFQSLQDWIEGVFLSKLREIFQNFIAGLANGNFNLGGILGSNGQAGAPGSFGNVLGNNFSSLRLGEYTPAIRSVSGVAGYALYQNGLQDDGGADSWAQTVGGGALAGWSIGGPIGAAIGAGVGAASAFLSFTNIFGRNSYEAGVPEISRDFGGIEIDQDTLESWLGMAGISESQAYGIRKDIFSSPRFLTEVLAPLAQQQGRMDDFLESLEDVQTSWGSFNFRDAFEVGQAVGDWTELNDQFERAFGDHNLSGGLLESLQIAENDTDSLINVFRSVRDSISQSIVNPMVSMLDRFMQTGDLTEHLRTELAALGADLAAFESLSDIAQLNQYFAEMGEHFRATGEILPDLRVLIEEYGGSLAALDQASGLPALMRQMGFIERLSGGLSNIAQQWDPINMLLQGQWNANIESALTEAGLDASRFQNLANIIGVQGQWGQISQGALGGGPVSEQLLGILSEYGGAAGQLAVGRYAQGFNTITAQLLESTNAAMTAAYSEEVQSALDYLAEIGEQTTSEIQQLMDVMENELSIVSENIVNALNEAREELVAALNDVILALYRNPELENNPPYQFPAGTTDITPTPAQTGTSYYPQFVFNGDIYGYDDFVARIGDAQYLLQQLGYSTGG